MAPACWCSCSARMVCLVAARCWALSLLAARAALRKVAALTAPCRGSCSAAAASTIPEATYTAASSNTFIFFSTPKTQAAAEAECMKKGGHLASYQNGAEQDEVEQYFVRKVC